MRDAAEAGFGSLTEPKDEQRRRRRRVVPFSSSI